MTESPPELLMEIMMQPSRRWLQATTDDKGEANLEGVAVTTEALVLRSTARATCGSSTFAKPLARRNRGARARRRTSRPSTCRSRSRRSATVQGTVVDAAGQPVLGVRVIAGREPYGVRADDVELAGRHVRADRSPARAERAFVQARRARDADQGVHD